MNEGVERVKTVLAALIKAALVSDDGKSLGYRETARSARAALAADPPGGAHLRIDGAWTFAIQEAETPELREEQGQVNLTLPRQSPFTLDALIAPGFDIDEAVETIRKSASTG